MKRILLLTVLAAAIAPAAFPQNMFRGNPAHTGVYDTEGPRQLKGVKWAFQTGGPVVSSPTVIDGVAYVGSDDKLLHAVDVATGKEKWKFATEGIVRSTPAVATGVVYFGSYDGVFYAVDAASGQLKWKFAMPGERKFEARGLHGYTPRMQTIPDFWDLYLSSPAVADGMVYFGSGDGNCYALDAATGQLKWKFETKGVVHSSPALANGAVFFRSWDTYLYAVDAATGQEKWKYKITWVNASAAVVDGSVYFGTSIPAFFIELDAKTGKERFKFDAHSPVFSSPAVAGGLAYFGSFNGSLYAVDLKDGKLAWEFQTESAKKNAPAYLKPDGGLNFATVFTSPFFEDMYHASVKLFSLGAIVSSPVMNHGVVYVGSADGNLYALE
jgi:outer membrane protein assembly factor BamB